MHEQLWRKNLPIVWSRSGIQRTMFSIFYEIRGRYHCLFKQVFGPLHKVMEYEDQCCLRFSLLELETQGKAVEGQQYNHTSSSTKNNHNFFSPITNATSQSRITQMGSWSGHNKGVTIGRAIAICRARRPWPHGPQSHHPCHWSIKVFISSHRRCFPCFGDLSILDWSMLEILQKQKLQYI